MTVISHSASSTSMILKKKDDFACNHRIDVWLLMKHHTDAEETPRHRKVRRPYVVLTQYILLNTPMIKIVHRSIAYDILWIKKYAIGSLWQRLIRQTNAPDTLTALPLRFKQSSYDYDTLLLFLQRTCDVRGGSICNKNVFITSSTSMLGFYAICETNI